MLGLRGGKERPDGSWDVREAWSTCGLSNVVTWGKIPSRRSSKYKAVDADLLLVCWKKECQCVRGGERKSSEFLPTEITWAVGFHIRPLLCWGVFYVPSKPTLLRVFIMNRFVLCQMLFLYLLKWSYGFYPVSCWCYASCQQICKYWTTLAPWK